MGKPETAEAFEDRELLFNADGVYGASIARAGFVTVDLYGCDDAALRLALSYDEAARLAAILQRCVRLFPETEVER